MSISKILKIMEFVLLNPEKYDEAYVKNKFGEKKYNLFSEFCVGGSQDMSLAHYIGPDKLKLTQRGVREYHKMVSEQTQKRFNLLMLIATSILAISAVLSLLKSVGFF